jgi:hypothetical protein
MGVSRNAGLEELAPVVDGGGWIRDPESGDLVLRPDWRQSWKDNSGWHNKAVTHLTQKIRDVNPAVTKEMMDEMTSAEILLRIQTVVKGITAKFRKYEKEKSENAPDDAANQRSANNR